MADWLVAAVLPSRNEAATIGAVTRSVALALGSPDAQIVNVDASLGGTAQEAFEAETTYCKKRFLNSPTAGKGRQLLLGVRALRNLPKSILFADTDTREPSSEIYSRLLEVIRCGADVAIANYRRAWYEGNLTNHLARPLIFASTGIDVPQPISGDLAISQRAAIKIVEAYRKLGSRRFRQCVGGYGIDAFMVLTALIHKMQVTSVDVDSIKLHAPSFPHLQQIYFEATPVLLHPSFRTLERVHAMHDAKFDIAQSGPEPNIGNMIAAISRLASIEQRIYDWTAEVQRAWVSSKKSSSIFSASARLWPAYAAQVVKYLSAGQGDLTRARGFLTDSFSEVTLRLGNHSAVS